MTIGTRIKSALTGTFRLSVSFVIAGALLILGTISVSRLQNAGLEEARTWPEQMVPSLDSARFSLKTSWQDGLLRYQFTVRGSSRFFRALQSSREENPFTIELLDADGFRLQRREVLRSRMRQSVDDRDSTVAYSWQDSDAMSASEAKSLSKFDVLWRISVERPRASSPPAPVRRTPSPPSRPYDAERWRSLSSWRDLSENITDDSVRKLLGEPTVIEDPAGRWVNDSFVPTMLIWRYGSSLPGYVVFDTRMRVVRWSVPR